MSGCGGTAVRLHITWPEPYAGALLAGQPNGGGGTQGALGSTPVAAMIRRRAKLSGTTRTPTFAGEAWDELTVVGDELRVAMRARVGDGAAASHAVYRRRQGAAGSSSSDAPPAA